MASSKKPFPYNQCPKAYSDGNKLKKHLRIHSDACNQANQIKTIN